MRTKIVWRTKSVEDISGLVENEFDKEQKIWEIGEWSKVGNLILVAHNSETTKQLATGAD